MPSASMVLALIALRLTTGVAHAATLAPDSRTSVGRLAMHRDAAEPTRPSKGRDHGKAPAPVPPKARGPAAPTHTSKGATGAAADSEDIETAEVSDVADDALYSDAYAQIDRTLDQLTARVTRRGAFNAIIVHRNHLGMLRAPFQDFLGFDGGSLKIGLGLRYGLLDTLDIGVLRLNGTVEVFDTYELDARYQAMRQEKHGIDVAVRGGVTWFAQPRAQRDAHGFMLQFLMSRVILDRIVVGGGVLYHSQSSSPTKNARDARGSTAVMGLLELRVTDLWAFDMEISETLAGYRGKFPIMTVGPRLITNRHTFAVVLSNSQYITADGLVANSNRASIKDWVLGFNITREI